MDQRIWYRLPDIPSFTLMSFTSCMFKLRRVHGDFHTTLESEVSLFRRLKSTQALVLGEGICVLFRDRGVLNLGCPF